MQEKCLEFLRCPVTRSPLNLKVIKKKIKQLDNISFEVVDEGILYSDSEWFYPIINGIPRLIVEAVIDYEYFLKIHIDNFESKKLDLLQKHEELINYVLKKNKKTKKSFSSEWEIFDYKSDKTWGLDGDDLIKRFCIETDEDLNSLSTKVVLDAGCGNAKLNMLLANIGIENIAMDFSNGILQAYQINTSSKVHFIQGDVQFPPFKHHYFDLVHCSGVLIHTNNTELSFSCLDTTVKVGGKYSVWLYHKRKNFIHNLLLSMRGFTSKSPVFIQQLFFNFILLPISFIVKRFKGNKQSINEMRIDILDGHTPEFRWEHGHTEAASWFYKRNYSNVKVTTNETFGFDIIGIKLL